MKKLLSVFPLLLFTTFLLNNQLIQAEEPTIKVLELKTNKIITETQASTDFDEYGKKAIKSINNVTVEANPLPKEGFLIKMTLTKPLLVKNKWFNDLVNEVILIYQPKYPTNGKVVLYTDENTPMFYDISYDLKELSVELEIE